MSSVDHRLRQAFATSDGEWVRRAPAAHGELLARHRRHQLVRLGAAGALAAAAVVVVVNVVDGDTATRTIQPADPTPTSTTPAGATPLEGTWISDRLRGADVRTAARRAGAPPEVAATMLEDLPSGSFRVVMIVQGSSLRTFVRSAGAEDATMDEEVLSTNGQDLELTTVFGESNSSVHRWAVQGDELTMTFESTSEGAQDGVPGEAWQRLLYDTAPLVLQDP